MADEPIRWGICGTGNIARKFAADLRMLPGATVAAVGSRSGPAAAAFASEHPGARSYASYAELADDDQVDVVYVATPQSRHRDDTIMFIEAGRPVLCEKPFALTAAEAEEMVGAARAAGVFLMEAMWMRFLPVYAELRRLLADRAIGVLSSLSADFGYRVEPDSPHRLLDAALGGGSLLDLGIYPLSLAAMVFGPPDRVQAVSSIDKNAGVDSQTAALLSYPGGELAVLHSSILGRTCGTASITGSAGRIVIAAPFHGGRVLTMDSPSGRTEFSRPFDGTGLHFEAAAVQAALSAGWTESPIVPLDETVAIMSTVDEIRRQADPLG